MLPKVLDDNAFERQMRARLAAEPSQVPLGAVDMETDVAVTQSVQPAGNRSELPHDSLVCVHPAQVLCAFEPSAWELCRTYVTYVHYPTRQQVVRCGYRGCMSAVAIGALLRLSSCLI